MFWVKTLTMISLQRQRGWLRFISMFNMGNFWTLIAYTKIVQGPYLLRTFLLCLWTK